MGKTIVKIVGAIFVGVAVWWLTEGLRGRDNPGGAAVPASIPDKPPPTKYRMAPEPNINRNAGDYKDFVASDFQQCLDTCVQEDECKAVTFNKASKQCWMKSSVPHRSDDPGYDSAVKVVTE